MNVKCGPDLIMMPLPFIRPELALNALRPDNLLPGHNSISMMPISFEEDQTGLMRQSW
jgi:hypothetical protein